MIHAPQPYPALSESPTPRRPVRQALALLALLAPAAVVASWSLAEMSGDPRPLQPAGLTAALVTLGAASIVMGLARTGSFPHRSLGWGNGITLTRGAGISVLAGLVLAPAAGLGWGLVALAGLLILMDGIDGWAARRQARQSRFGARLDVETDVALALVLGALAVTLGQVGPWFLALGLLRPAFLAAGRVWPALAAPLPEAARRKRMAGLQMVVQVVLLAPVLAPPVSSLIGAALLGAMLLSFAVDVRWLLRQPPAA